MFLASCLYYSLSVFRTQSYLPLKFLQIRINADFPKVYILIWANQSE